MVEESVLAPIADIFFQKYAITSFVLEYYERP